MCQPALRPNLCGRPKKFARKSEPGGVARACDMVHASNLLDDFVNRLGARRTSRTYGPNYMDNRACKVAGPGGRTVLVINNAKLILLLR